MPESSLAAVRLAEAPASETEPSLGRMFFDGLPAMAGIVTVITQPFAQESLRATLRLPDWLPIVLAVAISGLLAVYKVVVVRRSGVRECAVCVPVLMLVIFSAYATGNNVVYYAKEGLAKSGEPATASAAELGSLKQERELLQRQLKNAQELIDALRHAVSVPEGGEGKPKPRALAPSRLARWAFGVSEAHAQAPRRPPADARAETGLRELRMKLGKYETEQRELARKLEDLKREEKSRERQQKPLIKAW